MSVVAPIFILGAHKSGSSLLRALLDGHPGLFVLPKETHVFQAAGESVDYPLRRSLGPPRRGQELRDALLAAAAAEGEAGQNPFSDEPEFQGYDLQALACHLRDMKGDTPSDYVPAFLEALALSLRGRAMQADQVLVEKSVEHAEFAPLLQRIFPEARFLHIVRNPYANLVSLRLSVQRRLGGFPRLPRLVGSLFANYSALYRNRLLIDQLLVIRYEDLVTDVASTMRQVSSFLRLRYDDALSEPTSMGRPWPGNSTSGEAFKGVSVSPVGSWTRNVTPVEIAAVNATAVRVLADYGYGKLPTPAKLRLLRPALHEPPMTWMVNRCMAATTVMASDDYPFRPMIAK